MLKPNSRVGLLLRERVITTKSSLTMVELIRRHKELYCSDTSIQILLFQKCKE